MILRCSVRWAFNAVTTVAGMWIVRRLRAMVGHLTNDLAAFVDEVVSRRASAGVRVVRTPPHAPNCNAYAERFVRSVKEECLNRIVPLDERHLRKTLHEFATHYHRERNHQGLANKLIEHPAANDRLASLTSCPQFAASAASRGAIETPLECELRYALGARAGAVPNSGRPSTTACARVCARPALTKSGAGRGRRIGRTLSRDFDAPLVAGCKASSTNCAPPSRYSSTSLRV
jgi:hypothetical protein